jgi:hypothetical protein
MARLVVEPPPTEGYSFQPPEQPKVRPVIPTLVGNYWLCLAGVFVIVLVGAFAGTLLRVGNNSGDKPLHLGTNDTTIGNLRSSSPLASPVQLLELRNFLPNFTLQTIAQKGTSPQARAVEWVLDHPEFGTMPTR